MKKICSSCKEEKNTSEFRKDRTRIDGYQPHCKICAREKHNSLYMIKYKDKIKQRDDNTRAVNKALFLEYKRTHPCVNCGESEICCIDFHHTDPNEKEFGIAESMYRSWTKIVAELEKCIPLCANCHRKLHNGIIEI